MITKDLPDAKRLLEIARQCDRTIATIQEAEFLLNDTFGVCLGQMPHADAQAIHEASKTLTHHLSWLMARAVSRRLLLEPAGEDRDEIARMCR